MSAGEILLHDVVYSWHIEYLESLSYGGFCSSFFLSERAYQCHQDRIRYPAIVNMKNGMLICLVVVHNLISVRSSPF